MPPSEHSKYSPSGMASMMLCLGKMKATEGMNGGSSAAADRGTEVHDHLEKKVINPDVVSPVWIEDWQEECMQDCFNHSMDAYDELSLMGDVKIMLEEKVDLGWLGNENVPYMDEVYGTADVVMYCQDSKTLVVLDYKTGKGIEVDPVNNVQGMIYALGTIGLYPDAERVVIAISQPRIHKEIQTWTTSADDLKEWAAETLLPAVRSMTQDNAPRTPGESQCKWCAIKGTCTAQSKKYLDMLDDAPVEKVTSGLLSDQELNDLLLRVKEFNLWINAVTGAAQGILETGGDLPDFKLVSGRGSRQWSDLGAAEKFMTGQKLKLHERNELKLLSVAKCEKVLKKNLQRTITKNNFDKLVVRKQGKPTWCLKTDKREAINVADPLDELINVEDLY